MCLIYFDWNVFSNLKKQESTNEIIQLREFIQKSSDKFLFPYSDAHLNDLMVTYDKGDYEYITCDLNHLKSITKNEYIGQNFDDGKVFMDKKDPVELFKEMIDRANQNTNNTSPSSFESFLNSLGGRKMIEQIKELFENIPLNLSPSDANNPILKTILPNCHEKPNLWEFVKDSWHFVNPASPNNSEKYSKLRTCEQKSLNLNPININNYKNPIDSLNKDLPETDLQMSYDDVYKYQNNVFTGNNELSKKIYIHYRLLDLFGYRSDKLTKKNKFSNFINDSLHCFYAAHCAYYITNDKDNYSKSKSIYQTEKSISTEVMSVEKFVNHINNR